MKQPDRPRRGARRARDPRGRRRRRRRHARPRRPSATTLTISNWDAYTPKDLIPSSRRRRGSRSSSRSTRPTRTSWASSRPRTAAATTSSSSPARSPSRSSKRGWAARLDHKQTPEPEEPLPGRLQAGLRPRQQVLGAVHVGDDGPLLAQRPDEGPDELERPAQAVGRAEGQDDDARDRPLADAAGAQGARLLAQHGQPGPAEEGRGLLKETKKTLLAYDDTTFYSKLVSGEAKLVEAWDGWCNYGIAENPKIKFIIPKEGSDVLVDTMVVLGRARTRRPPTSSSTTSCGPTAARP